MESGQKQPVIQLANLFIQLQRQRKNMIIFYNCFVNLFNYSHLNKFNGLSWPSDDFLVSALHRQTPWGQLLHFNKEVKSTREEHLPWQLSCHMAFLLCLIFLSMPHWNQSWHAFKSSWQVANKNLFGFFLLLRYVTGAGGRLRLSTGKECAKSKQTKTWIRN